MIALRAIVLYVWMLSCLIVGKSAKGEAAYMFQDVPGQGEPIQPRVNRHEGYNTESEGNTVHIFFGSCNSHIRDQSIWNVIKRKVLDEYPGSLWVWLGDVIYADNFDSTRLRFRSNSRNEVQQRYDIQRRSPNYAAIADVVPILGIWDDHDYGINDGDRDFPDKFQMQQVFLDFLDVPSSAPIRSQLGLYSYQRILSPKGDRTVLIILLDNRFHKTPYGTDEEEGDFLGEEQWLWLQETLRNVPSDVTLIGSGIQVLASTKPAEDWSRFPNSYRRLLALLAETERPGVVFLSGDIHIAELHRDPCPSPVAYPLYDLTSSGLTHAVPTFVKHLIEIFLYTSTLKQSHYGKNFGHVAIDFDRESIELMAYDVIGNIRIHHTVPFSEIHIPMTQGKQRAQHTCPARIVSPLALVMRSVVRFLERISLRAGIAPSGFHLSLLFLLCIIVTAIYFIFLALRKCAAFMCNRNRSDLKKMK